MNAGRIEQLGAPREIYERPANEFVRDFVGKTLLLRGRVQSANPSGQLAVAIDGAPDCVVFGRAFRPEGLSTGREVYVGVRPEDVELTPAAADRLPAGMLEGRGEAALFVGDRIEYQLHVDEQRPMVVYGPRHQPAEEGGRVWLKLRPEGHSAWPTDWAQTEPEEVNQQ